MIIQMLVFLIAFTLTVKRHFQLDFHEMSRNGCSKIQCAHWKCIL